MNLIHCQNKISWGSRTWCLYYILVYWLVDCGDRAKQWIILQQVMTAFAFPLQCLDEKKQGVCLYLTDKEWVTQYIRWRAWFEVQNKNNTGHVIITWLTWVTISSSSSASSPNDNRLKFLTKQVWSTFHNYSATLPSQQQIEEQRKCV